MSARAPERVFDKALVKVGDEIAYTQARAKGQKFRPGPVDRDWLRVTRIDSAGVHGIRVNPEEWERDVEFVIVNLQIRDNGVLLGR